MRKSIRCILSLIFSILCINLTYTQQESYTPTLKINKTAEDIKIDGLLTEEIWQSAQVADNFQMTFPFDSTKAVSKTEVRLAYDDKNFYVAAICYDEIKDKPYVAQSLKRDFSFPVNDAFAVFIDAYGDSNTGLSFSVSPYGVQRDGTIERGGTRGVSTAWNGLWHSDVKQGDGYWSLEMAIPFKTLRYNPQATEWKINFARNDLKRVETSTWSPVPRNINVALLGHAGTLVWDSPPKKSVGKVTLVPYVIGSVSRDLEAINTDPQVKKNFAGVDAKYAINSSLNLEVTINPDFSQVEVDRQVINLDRFEVSFPERRLFFLENSDMFSLLGNSRVRPFFSRRIGGVGSDPVPLLGGIKLSGAIGEQWRIGILDVQTKQEDGVDDGQNYLVASIARKIKTDSANMVVTGFITNRQAFDKDYKVIDNNFNLTGGANFNYRKNSLLNGDAYVNFSTNQDKLDKFMSYGAKLRYKTPKVNIFGGVDVVGENYITDMGFVPRLYHTDTNGNSVRIGYTQFRTNGYYRFYFPKDEETNNNNRKLDYTGPTFHFDLFTNSDLSYQEHVASVGWELGLLNKSIFSLEYFQSNPIIFYEFQLSGLDDKFEAGNYSQNYVEFKYSSGKQNIINGELNIGYGDKFSGKLFNIDGELNYRPAKWGSFGVNFTHDELFDFPSNFGSGTLTLLGTQAEFSFSKDLFWTTYLQYNTVQSNLNVNTRFQYRYAPLSDIFLVFTNNSSTDAIAEKNWSVALKINYWLSF